MTDCDFLLEVLADGREHTLAEILARSLNERGHGITVHSRAAELRRRGHQVEHVTIPGARRGAAHAYRLVSFAEPEAAIQPPQEDHATASGCASDDTLALFTVPRGAYDGEAAA